ncbi:MAG: GIY-YIG nuclease family protein [Flavobacteriaceae bacterium]|nr:GIY-YIG nuclease family protein [Flavobacteriaceae bacterium]
MEHFVYIIWSEKIGKYYCGESNNVEARLAVHNRGGCIYTKKGIPWILIKIFVVSNRSEARNLEKRIKQRGIKRFLLNTE